MCFNAALGKCLGSSVANRRNDGRSPHYEHDFPETRFPLTGGTKKLYLGCNDLPVSDAQLGMHALKPDSPGRRGLVGLRRRREVPSRGKAQRWKRRGPAGSWAIPALDALTPCWRWKCDDPSLLNTYNVVSCVVALHNKSRTSRLVAES